LFLEPTVLNNIERKNTILTFLRGRRRRRRSRRRRRRKRRRRRRRRIEFLNFKKLYHFAEFYMFRFV